MAHTGEIDAGAHTQERPPHWIEPGTGRTYPYRFEVYRRLRETEERPLPRHRGLGADVDRYVWRRWGAGRSPDIDVQLTLRPDTSPRIRRLAGQILGAIRRGRPAADAISETSRRFGLRPSRTRAFLAASMQFTAVPRGDGLTRLTERPWLS